MFSEDDDLFSIGLVAVAEEDEEMDMASDTSDWVRQYTDWEDGTPDGAAVPPPKTR